MPANTVIPTLYLPISDWIKNYILGSSDVVVGVFAQVKPGIKINKVDCLRLERLIQCIYLTLKFARNKILMNKNE